MKYGSYAFDTIVVYSPIEVAYTWPPFVEPLRLLKSKQEPHRDQIQRVSVS
jgi:hypothetical protein